MNQLVKLFVAALKKAAKKEGETGKNIVGRCVVLQVVKVVGVGVTVKVGLHGLRKIFLLECYVGRMLDRLVKVVGVGVTVEVGLQ
jgi:hypothetical protein